MLITEKTKAIGIFGLFLLVAVGVFIFGYFRANEPEAVDTMENVEVDDDGVLRPSKQLLESSTGKSYEELKMEAPEVVTSPNIYDEESKKQFEEIAGSQNPENYFVVYNGSSFEPASITIFQGDLVTFSNSSLSSFKVKGELDWGSMLAIEPEKAFSQQFDYLGTYKYSVEGNDKISGEIIVLVR